MATHDHTAKKEGERYRGFAAFYPFYLTEHVNRTSRRLHVIGTTLVIAALVCGFLVDWRFFVAAPLVGYGFAWSGISCSGRTGQPRSSTRSTAWAGDFRLWFEVVTGKRPF